MLAGKQTLSDYHIPVTPTAVLRQWQCSRGSRPSPTLIWSPVALGPSIAAMLAEKQNLSDLDDQVWFENRRVSGNARGEAGPLRPPSASSTTSGASVAMLAEKQNLSDHQAVAF